MVASGGVLKWGIPQEIDGFVIPNVKLETATAMGLASFDQAHAFEDLACIAMSPAKTVTMSRDDAFTDQRSDRSATGFSDADPLSFGMLM